MIVPTGDRLNHDIRQRCHRRENHGGVQSGREAFGPMRRDRRLSAMACVSSNKAPLRDNLTH
jgi:hypothetical protein